jgi:hypothetical protein
MVILSFTRLLGVVHPSGFALMSPTNAELGSCADIDVVCANCADIDVAREMHVSEVPPQTDPLTLNHKVCSTAIYATAPFCRLCRQAYASAGRKERGIRRKPGVGGMQSEDRSWSHLSTLFGHQGRSEAP